MVSLNEYYFPVGLCEESSCTVVDDVRPLPFGEPVNLMFRENCRAVHLPYMTELGGAYNVSIYSGTEELLELAVDVLVKNGEFKIEAVLGTVRLHTYDGETWYDSVGTLVAAPTVSIENLGAVVFYDSSNYEVYRFDATHPVDGFDDSVKLAFRQLCQMVNVSTDAMGSISDVDFVEVFTGEIGYNRTYAMRLTGTESDFQLPVNRLDVPGVPDGYAVVYLTIDQDMDFGFDADYFVGGEVPSTTAGVHKLIYNFLPNQQISLGGLDLEVTTE